MSFVAIPNYRRNYWSGPGDKMSASGTILNSNTFYSDGGKIWTTTTFGSITQHSTHSTTTHKFQKFYQDTNGDLYAYGDGYSTWSTTNTPVSKYQISNGTWATLGVFPEPVRIQSLCRLYNTEEGVSNTWALTAIATPTNSASNTSGSDIVYAYVYDGASWTRYNALPSGYRFGELSLYTKRFYYETGGTPPDYVDGSSFLFYNSTAGLLRSDTPSFYSSTQVSSSGTSGVYGSNCKIIQYPNSSGGVRLIRPWAQGISYSDDAGVTWTDVNFGSGSYTMQGIAYHPSTGSTIVIAYGSGTNGALGANIWHFYADTPQSFTKLSGSTITNMYADLYSCGFSATNTFFVADASGSNVYTINASEVTSNTWIRLTALPYSGVLFNRLYGQSREREIYRYYGTNALSEKPNIASFPMDIPQYSNWDRLNFFSATLVGSSDDGYYANDIPIGFNWGYNGSTYTNFKLNTNGMMQFSNFNNKYYNWDTSDIGILGCFGDLRLSPQDAPSFSEDMITTIEAPSTSVPALYTISNITTSGVKATPGGKTSGETSYLVLEGNNASNSITGSAPFICKITEYQRSSVSGQPPAGTFSINKSVYVIPGCPIVVPEIEGTNVTHLTAQFIKIPMPEYLSNNHFAYKKTISWVDEGVTHYIFRLRVNCTRYTNRNAYVGYNISLYKCGAIQFITTHLSPYSTTIQDLSVSSISNKKVGPWPFANDSNKAAFNTFTENTWVSYDNGTTWSNTKPNHTVVNTGPAQFTVGVTQNASLEYMYRTFDQSTPTTKVYDYTPRGLNVLPPYTLTGFGTNMSTYMLKEIVGLLSTSSNPKEVTLSNIFNQTYAVRTGGSKKNPSYTYYKYADLTRDLSFDLTDAIEAIRIAAGDPPNDPDSSASANLLVNRIITQGNEFLEWAIDEGIIAGPMTSFTRVYNLFPSGVVTENGLKQNIGFSSFSGLGPLSLINVQSSVTNTETPLFTWSVTSPAYESNGTVPEKTAYVRKESII